MAYIPNEKRTQIKNIQYDKLKIVFIEASLLKTDEKEYRINVVNNRITLPLFLFFAIMEIQFFVNNKNWPTFNSIKYLTNI